jgi:hypothetical protein
VLDKPRVEAVLSVVLGNAGTVVPDTDYRIVGTAAALLHGVQLPAGDVDVLLRNREGVDAFSDTLSSWKCLSPPSFLEWGQYFAAFEIDGVEVEFSTVEVPIESDTWECSGPGPWMRHTYMTCGSGRVPVVDLELRFLTELTRGRADRYVPIWEFMQMRGYDHDPVARGLKERNITEVEHLDLAQFRCTADGGS